METTTFYCSCCKQTLTVVHDGPAHGTGYALPTEEGEKVFEKRLTRARNALRRAIGHTTISGP